jgi:LmbE family N-acetylglucosaminyl deacetylase
VATPEPLPPLSEDWETVLVVVAHPDDLEFGGAAAVALWTNLGQRVVYCPLRESEQRESARNVGVDEVEVLGLPGGMLEYGVPLRREIARVVRRYRPQVVLTNDFKDRWAGSANLNQADHIACGKATLDAVRDAGNRWVFSDLGLEPWGGVKQVWAAASPQAKHGVDVTATFDRGLESLNAHAAYIAGLGEGAFDPEEFLEGAGRSVGSRIGAKYGAGFEVFYFNLF